MKPFFTVDDVTNITHISLVYDG